MTKFMKFLRKELFEIPCWLKPEVNTIIYYIHVGILGFVVLGLLQLFFGGNMLTLGNVLLSIPLITFSDFIAHSMLQLD